MTERLLQPSLGLDLVRATVAAALSASRWVGRGEKEAADQAAVDAIRAALASVDVDGVVVATEGEKDEAPCFAVGERLGSGRGHKVDVAVDPIDGTSFTAKGLPNAIAVMAMADEGSMYRAPSIHYTNKIAVGPEAHGAIDIDAPPRDNLKRIARFMDRRVSDLTVVMLDRPRNEALTHEVRAAGARLKLISGGDVAAAVETAMPDDRGVHVLIGIGGTPEAVLAACALKALGGEMQCRLWPGSAEERQRGLDAGISDLDRLLTLEDLVSGGSVFFAATGITEGEFLRGIRFHGEVARADSIVVESASRTLRRIETWHPIGPPSPPS